MRFVWRLTSFICCSSQKPISRRRCETSGGAEICLMRTALPATTRLSGQRNGSRVQPLSPKQLDMKPFTFDLNIMVIETELQERLFNIPPQLRSRKPLPFTNFGFEVRLILSNLRLHRPIQRLQLCRL